MTGYEDKLKRRTILLNTHTLQRYRYGAWVYTNNVALEGKDSLHVYGPLIKQSNFYKVFKDNVSAFKTNNNIRL